MSLRRWVPCPYCKAEGWDSGQEAWSGLYDHDLPYRKAQCTQAYNQLTTEQRTVLRQQWSRAVLARSARTKRG